MTANLLLCQLFTCPGDGCCVSRMAPRFSSFLLVSLSPRGNHGLSQCFPINMQDPPEHHSFLIKRELSLENSDQGCGGGRGVAILHKGFKVLASNPEILDPSWKLFLGNCYLGALLSFPDERFTHKQQHLIISLNRGTCNTLLCRLISQKIPCIYD